MAEMLANAASTTLTAAVTPSGTTLTVASSSAFPTTGDYAIVVDGNTTNAEIMEVTAVSGNSWTVTRASEPYGGTQTAVSHASGGTVAQVLTVQGLTNFSGALNQANTWMVAQTFKPSGTTSQWVVIQPDPNYSFVGIYNGGTYYGIAPGLPSRSGYATIGGYYSGLGIGGNASSSQSNVPIFGVLASNQSANGIGNVALTVYSNNVIESFNNTLDDGSGNMTATGLITAAGGITLPSGQSFTNSGAYLGSPVVLALSGGTGISVTNPTSPGTAVVTNTGVTSLTAGTGIALSGNTGAVTISTTGGQTATTSTPGTVIVPALPASGNPLAPSVVASVFEQEITSTSATTVLSYTPSAAGLYRILIFYRIITASTAITLSLTYTDPGGTAQTDAIVPSATTQSVGNYTATSLCASAASDALTITLTAGTANQVYISAIIEGVAN